MPVRDGTGSIINFDFPSHNSLSLKFDTHIEVGEEGVGVGVLRSVSVRVLHL